MSNTEMNESGENTEVTPQDDASQRALTPGEQLAARRQELNLSIDQVATQLNLAPRQILAIEADNHAALPGIASVRGFIRSYAKLLRIDAAPLLEMIVTTPPVLYDAAPLHQALPQTTFSANRFSTSTGFRMPARSIAVLSILVLVVAVVVAGQQLGWNSMVVQSLSSQVDNGMSLLTGAKGNASPANAGGDAPAAKPNDAVKTNADAVSQTSVTVLAVPQIQDGAAAATAASPATAPLAAAAPVSSPVAIPAPQAAADADVTDMLVLKVREDSWIEVRRADKSPMISRLVKAGATESFKLTGPVSMTIGNASGVDATLRGEPLALPGDGKGNIARLNLK
ncbi:MAG: RodZ domain-containing protein [Pseudomonadota bacterium]